MNTTEPNPTWDAEAHADAVTTLGDLPDDADIHVWGADWCGDCRAELPDFFAALDAADVPEENVHVHPVDRDKRGELTEEYDVSRIATIVVERDGEELARFEESAEVPAAEAIATQLRERRSAAN